MTGPSEAAGVWDRPIGKVLVRAVICLLVAAGLVIFAGGPTWGAVGLSIVYVVGGLLIGLPTGSLLARSEDPARRLGLLECRAGRKQRFGAAAGYVLIALALVLWLSPLGRV
ncbi:hypothetical protein [Nonomuraea diastatica]|uniref:Uncharacterized protein n=1 Tax=Nonomuraea diastatica TaxID=1848329 RepID=A0A4R4W8H6_9ACTN|nr:hypothetical protein [Nonomuraea diastatica]TDD15038.1 hypothetical protein E1294_35575 [Nonomuraea diastatica]